MDRRRLPWTFAQIAWLVIVLIFSNLPLLASALDITWISPKSSDAYRPGDTINVEWQTSSKAVTSPSFKLCSSASSSDSDENDRRDVARGESHSESRSGDGNRDGDDSSAACGASIWPTVQQVGGSYTISLTIPDISTDAGESTRYHIVMEDDFGKRVSSPSFAVGASTPAASAMDSNSSADATSTSASSKTTSTSPESQTKFNSPVVTPSPEDAQYPVSAPPPNASTAAPGPAPSLQSPPFLPPSLPPITTPNLLAAHAPPPVVAIAVPLAVAGAIVLLAALLGFNHYRHQRRERRNERARLRGRVWDIERTNSSRSRSVDKASMRSPSSGGSQSTEAGAMVGGDAAPLPLFMPHGYVAEPVQYSAVSRPAALRQNVGLGYGQVYPSYAYALRKQQETQYPQAAAQRGPSPSPSHASSYNPYAEYHLAPPVPPFHYHQHHPYAQQAVVGGGGYGVGFRRPQEQRPYQYGPGELDVPITQSVLSAYMVPSPVLPTSASISAPPTPASLLSAPHRVHVHGHAGSDAAPKLSENPYLFKDKPLPRSPR